QDGRRSRADAPFRRYPRARAARFRARPSSRDGGSAEMGNPLTRSATKGRTLASALVLCVIGSTCTPSLMAEERPAPAADAPQPTKPKPAEPFAFADFSWVPGNYAAPEHPLSFGPFTGELRVDTAYHLSFNHPKDDTIGGSSEVFRHGEFQVT